jgi:hypothetical protein
MFDPIACAKMAVGAPCADLAALLELKQMLIEVGMPRKSPSDKGFVQEKDDEVSCPAVSVWPAPYCAEPCNI